MKILLIIALGLLKLFYLFIKLFPTQNKITLISRQSNKPSLDFILLNKKLSSKYKVVMLCKKLEPGIQNKIRYVFHIFVQMYHIATSKVVILDSYCIPVSVLKHKKKLVIIQMWHAMGSLKKFGLSVLETDTKTSAFNKTMSVDKKKEIANLMHMHENYDYIFASCKTSAPHFAEAFGYTLEHMVVMPLPSVDILNDSKYKKDITKEIRNKYKQMNKKKNIIYVPTFRPEEKENKIQDLIDNINYKKYNLIIKLHPLTKLSKYDDRVIWDKDYSSRDMMIACDYIITDYSAIVYEASLLDKPIFFYTYDYNDYVKKRDFYTDFKKELPGVMCDNAKDLIRAIDNNKYDLDRIKKFKDKYIDLNDELICDRIMNFIETAIEKKS